MWSMSGRPCNPDSDLKRLWRVLLPGTPFPRCGTPEEPTAPASENSATTADGAAGGEPPPTPAMRDT
jgi:hypothetical protein